MGKGNFVSFGRLASTSLMNCFPNAGERAPEGSRFIIQQGVGEREDGKQNIKNWYKIILSLCLILTQIKNQYPNLGHDLLKKFTR